MPLDYFENAPHSEAMSKSSAVARNEARAKKEEVAVETNFLSTAGDRSGRHHHTEGDCRGA